MDMIPDENQSPSEESSQEDESTSLAMPSEPSTASLEKDDTTPAAPLEVQDEPFQKKSARRSIGRREFLGLAAAFTAGVGSGYIIWGRPFASPVQTSSAANAASSPEEEIISEVATEIEVPANPLNLPDEFTLPVSFGNVGPQLLEAGAIDYEGFVQIYEQSGRPLTEEQLAILTEGSDAPIAINRESAYFLLNFLWAFGLANKNSLLEEGPMVQYSDGDIEGFASTGGWTLATKPIADLYASAPIISLSSEQQARMEVVAAGVYRPCCNNPTAFPDCNHGMAMLGLLELMATEDATVDEMFTAAKNVNAFWFPQQTLEIAVAYQNAYNKDFIEADAREFTGPNFSSGTGFKNVHQWLVDNNLLEQAPNQGGGCGV
jgi:hypothetical protein